MKAAGLTKHGAAIEPKPLRETFRSAPVMIREDIARRGDEAEHLPDDEMLPADRLALAMNYLSLKSAKFGGFGTEGDLVDTLVKQSVKSHHRTWVMWPLERLYDELVAMESSRGEWGNQEVEEEVGA